MHDLAVLLIRLTVALVDPAVIVIALLGALLPSFRSSLRRAVFVVVGAFIARFLFYTIATYHTPSEKMVAGLFGAMGALIWLAALSGIRRLVARRRQLAYEANPDPFYEKHRN